MKKNGRVYIQRGLLLLIAGATLLGVQAGPMSANASAMEAQGPGGTYELVWNDEFNGTKLDRTKWTYYAGGWSDGVQNCYTWQDEKNVSVGGGSLRITARHTPGAARCKGESRNFTSGFIQTRGGGPGGADNPRDKSPFKPSSFKYGYFEARMKMPKNKSTWPAFWMSPMHGKYGGWPASGEIDVMESKGSDYNYVAANLHYANDAGKRKQEQRITRAVDTTEWHTYAVKWEENRFEFFLDGKSYHVVENIKSKYPKYTNGHPFDQAFYLRLNLAVGGKYVNPSTTQTSPYSDPTTAIKAITGFKESFPDTMEVDYVRVYQKNPQLEQQEKQREQEKRERAERERQKQEEERKKQEQANQNRGSAVGFWEWFRRLFGF